MTREKIDIEEIKAYSEKIPENGSLLFSEARDIKWSTTEIIEMISLAYALGFKRGQALETII